MTDYKKCDHCGEKFEDYEIKNHKEKCFSNPDKESFAGLLALFGILFAAGIIANIFFIFSSVYLLLSIAYALITIYTIFIFYLFIYRKEEFIPNIKAYLWINLIISVVIWLTSILNYQELTYLGGTLFSVIFLLYFYNSVKAQSFFTNKTKWIERLKEHI